MSESGYSFSKKFPDSFDKCKASSVLWSKIKNLDDLFIICRSSVAGINFQEFDHEAEKAITHFQNIKVAQLFLLQGLLSLYLVFVLFLKSL